MPFTGYHIENCKIVSYELGGARTPMIGQTFLADPLGSLRRQGFAVLPATEPAWRQLAFALQALQRASAESAPAQAGAQAPYLEICIPVR
jgi:hypothetical protein